MSAVTTKHTKYTKMKFFRFPPSFVCLVCFVVALP
jgi:hypothetical protein